MLSGKFWYIEIQSKSQETCISLKTCLFIWREWSSKERHSDVLVLDACTCGASSLLIRSSPLEMCSSHCFGSVCWGVILSFSTVSDSWCSWRAWDPITTGAALVYLSYFRRRNGLLNDKVRFYLYLHALRSSSHPRGISSTWFCERRREGS